MNVYIDLPAWTVMIAEDDPLIQLGLEQVLADYPQLHIVATAKSGQSALEQAIEYQPDLILMDIGLPGIDGITTTFELKRRLPNCSVIIVTSHQTKAEVFSAFSSGADAYCVKGSEIETLQVALAAVSKGAIYIDPQIAAVATQILKDIPIHRSPLKIPLSSREIDVLNLLVEGLSNPEIARCLRISPNTVKARIRGVMNKLSVSDRVQVAVKAFRAGLIS